MSYLKTFFAEKNLEPVTWTLYAEDGTPNIIESAVVIEAIHGTTGQERKAIERQIRRLDFLNADINDFLKHLAGALVRSF